MAGIKFTSRQKSGNNSNIKINWKNVAGKAGENAANIFAPVMPTTVGTAINTTQAIRDIRRATRSQRITQRARNDSSAQDIKKSMAMLNSAFGDIEKGNYSLDKANRELYDDFDSETADDFEMPHGDAASGMSSEEITLLGNRGIAKSIVQSSSAQLRGMQGVASALINANIKSSRAIIDSTTSTMKVGFNALNTSITITNQKLDTINQGIQSILAFNNQNTIQFYQTAINMMNGMGAMMENLQNTMTPTERDKGRRLDFRNGFSPRAFVDYLKEGIQESMMGAMFGAAGDGSRVNPSLRNLTRNGGRGFGAMGGLMGMVLGKLVPKSIENSLGQFDKSLQTLMETGIARLGEKLDTHPLLGALGLGNILGNKREGLNNVKMGKYMKDALPWNGMAQKALVEVIPEYLSSMETSLNALTENFVSAKGRQSASQRKRYYDYNGGQFMSQKELRKQFESEYMDRINMAMKESMDSLVEVVAGTGKTSKEQDRIIAQIERLIDQRITEKSNGAAAQENWKQMTEVLARSGVGKDKGLSVINQITAGVTEAINQLNDLTHEVETTQNIYRNLNTTQHREAFGQMRSKISRSGQGKGEAIQYRGFSKIGSVEKFIHNAEKDFTSQGSPSLSKDKDLQAFVISMMYSGMDDTAIQDAIIAQIAARHQAEAIKRQLLNSTDSPSGLRGIMYRGQRAMVRAQDRLDRAADVISPYLDQATTGVLNRADRVINGRSAWDEEEPVGHGRGSRRAIGYGPAEMGKFAARNGYISGGGANARLFTEGAARLGMGATPVTSTRQLKASLASGRPVILGGRSTGYGSPYTAAGHIVAADKLQGNKARVLDPMTGKKSYYSLNALGAGATHAWDYAPMGYGPGATTRRRRAASTRYTQRLRGGQSSEVDQRGVAGIEKQALVSQEYNLNRSQTEIDREMNVTNKLIRDMQREPPSPTIEGSIIQSNNMVRAALGNVITNLNAGMAKVFGKEGFLRSFWDSDARKELTAKLFTGEDAVFGEQYKWAKEKLGNFKKRVGEEVGKGYDFLYDNTMQYLYGRDEEGNDIHYSQNAKWQNSKFMSQTVNRRYRSDQRAIRKAKREAEKNGTELADEFKNTTRDYVYGEADENDPNKIIRSSYDTATKKWTSFTAEQWGKELERRQQEKKEKSEDTGTKDATKSLTDNVRDFASDVRANASEASKKLVASANELIHSNQVSGQVADSLANAASNAAEVVTDQADRLKEDLEAVRETVTGNASEDAKAKSSAFKKSFLDKMKSAMPKALVAAGAGAALGTVNAMSPSLLGAMFLPGGPVAGAIFGGALSLLSQTEAFKTFMFGKQDPETQKREGGLISSKMQAGFKKAAPYMIGGAVLGGIKGLVKSTLGFNSGLGVMGIQLLPGGILGGALLGAGLGVLKNSESFKKMLFGEKGEDGKRSGKFLSDGWNRVTKGFKAMLPKFGKAAAGAGAGALSGAVLANAGMLPAMLSFGGPVGMGIMGLGLGIASSTSKFNEWMFGSEMLDEHGNPTGKRYKDGVLNRVQNLLTTNVIEPIGTAFKDKMLDLVDWTKEKITLPFRMAFGPILDSFTNIKDDIVDFVHDTFERIGNGIMDAFKGAIKTVFSPITKIVGFVGKNITGITSAGVKLALTPLSIGLGGLSMLTAPKRGKEYAKYYSSYYKSGLTDKLKEYWAASEKDGQKRTFGQKFNDIVDTFTGKGVIGDEFYDTYNKQMEEAGEGHLKWRRAPREKRDIRAQRRERRQESKKWNSIDAERRKIINRDLGGREVTLTDDKVKDYRKRFKKLGIAEDKLQTSDDIMKLLYDRDNFKQSLDPNKAAAAAGGETDEQKKAREKTSQHQDNVEAFLESLHKSTEEIAGVILAEKGADMERRDWKKRRKKLKDRMKRAGVRIDLNDDLLKYWDTERLTRDTLEDFKLGEEKDIYKFMYKRGIAHRENAETNQQIADMLASMGFNPSEDEIPDIEGTPAPPKPAKAKKKGLFSRMRNLFKKKSTNEPEEEETESEDSTVGFGSPFFIHTPIGYGPGADTKKRGPRTAVQMLLARIADSIAGLNKTATEQKEIQSAQLEVATQGEIDDTAVRKKKGKSFGSRIMSRFNTFTSWLGFKKKKDAADKEAAESAAAREGTADEATGEDGVDVNVNVNNGEEKKTGFFGTIWNAIKGFGSTIGNSKVGGFMIKGIKTLGTMGLLGTVGFTIAELVRPGTAENIGKNIDKLSQYINSEDFSLGKMFTDIKDIAVGKAKEFGNWFTENAYPWVIEHTGPIGEWFDTKVTPWLTDTGEKMGSWWDETAWPFLQQLPGKMLDGFVTTTAVVGDFIVNNTDKIIGATATVVENIIEPMGKLVVDLFIGIGKGLWAYIQKKFNPFYKDKDDDISNTDEMFAKYTGTNVNYESIGTASTEEEARQMMEDAGYENSVITQNANGEYEVKNRRILGNHTAVDADNNTTNVANGNMMSAFLKNAVNLINPATRTATAEGLKLGAKAGVGGVKGVLGAASTAGKVLGKIPIIGNVFKAGGAISNLAKNGIGLAEKGVERASGFFSNLAQRFGSKAAIKAAEEGAEEAVEAVAEEVIEKGTQTVAKETTEKGVMATIKEILKRAVEATEKVATNGILEKAVSSLGANQKSTVMSKIAKRLVEALNDISKAPAKFANKILETLQGSLTKATGETALGAGTAGISIAVMATISGVMGAVDAPNLFGVKAEDCTGGMRVVSAIFEALLSIPWVGTFMEAAMLILSFAFNRNLKQELATSFYEFVCAGDIEKIQNLENSRARMDAERQVYNKLHGTNLDADAYNDLENKTVIGSALDWGKKGVNWVAGLMGQKVFNVAESTDSSADLVKALQNAGYTTEQINALSAEDLKSKATELGIGFGPSATINALNAVNKTAARSIRAINGVTGNSVRALAGTFGSTFNNKQGVNQSAIAHTVGSGNEFSMLSVVQSIDTKLGALCQLLGVQVSTTTANASQPKTNLLTNAFNSVLSVLASAGMIKSTNSSELKSNLQNMVSNSAILSRVKSTLQKLNPAAYAAMGYGEADMYKQGNSSWGNMPIGTFPNGQVATMKDAGCGPTALAAVANQLMGYGMPPEGYGPISPAQMGAYAASNGYISGGGANARLFTEGAAKMGLNSTPVTDATGVKASLMTGKPVVMTGTSSSSGDPYTKAGHIVVADGIKGNRASVLDPMTGKHRTYDLNSMAKRTQHAWSYSRPAIGYGANPSRAELYGSFGSSNTGSGGFGRNSTPTYSSSNPFINSSFMVPTLPGTTTSTASTNGGSNPNNASVTTTGKPSTYKTDLFGSVSSSETNYDATKHFGRHTDSSGIDSLAMDKNYEYFVYKTNNFAKASGNYKNCSNYTIGQIGNDKKVFVRTGLHWLLNTQYFGLKGGKFGNITIEYRTNGPRHNAVNPSTITKTEKIKILAAGAISKFRYGTAGPVKILPLSAAEKVAILCNGLRVICGPYALATYLSTRSNFDKLIAGITDVEIESAYNSATGKTDNPDAAADLVNSDGTVDEAAVNELAATPASTKGIFNQEELEAYKKWKDDQDAGKGFFGKTVSGFALLSKIIKAKINSILNGTNFYDELAAITTDETDQMYGVTSSESGDNNAVSINYTTDGSTSVNIAGNNTKEKIWNYLRGSGLSPYAAAGVMGCWEAESSNNPETLEGWYLTKTPVKDIIASNSSLDKFTTSTLFPAYVRSNISINRNAYKGKNGHYYPGLGLAQWTGPRGFNLFEYARENKYNWGEVGPQLKFYQQEFDQRSGLKQKMNSATSPKDAAKKFFDGFEMYNGYADEHPSALKKRSDPAQEYYDMYRNLTADAVGFGIGEETEEAPPAKLTMQQYREGMDTVSNTMADYILNKVGVDIRSLSSSSSTSTEDGSEYSDGTAGFNSGSSITLNTADQKNFRADSNTEIVTSESGWNSKTPFWTKTRKKGNGNWGAGSSYKFRGFIYNPATSFTPRLTRPTAGNKYYITKDKGGWSNAIKGSPVDSQNNVLSNCVGYAYGRFNEIGNWGSCKYLSPCHAENFIENRGGLEYGQEPRLGAVMVWQKGQVGNSEDGAGHVAIVEQINGQSNAGNGLGYGPTEDGVENMSWGQQMNWLGNKIAELYGATGLPMPGTTSSANGISITDDGYVTGDASIVTGGNVEETIWKTLRNAGLSPAGAAGVMGNLYAESGLRSNNLQNSYEKKLGYSDASYTSAVDGGSYNNFVKDKAGYGLAQWTYWSRKQNLLNFAKKQGKSIGDAGMQTQFLLNELGSYGLLDSLKSATSVKAASNDMLLKFEKPANQGISVQNKRASYSQGYYDKYASLGFGPGRKSSSVQSPAAREMQRRRMIEAKPFTVDPKEFKELGFGDGMRVDAGFDMGSTDSRLDRIMGIMTEWMAESRDRATGAPSQNKTDNNTVNAVVNNNTVVSSSSQQRGFDAVKPERFKSTMLRQHRVLSGRVNARKA